MKNSSLNAGIISGMITAAFVSSGPARALLAQLPYYSGDESIRPDDPCATVKDNPNKRGQLKFARKAGETRARELAACPQ